MDRHICFLLAIPLAFLVSPSLYAQHGSGGGQGRGHGGGPAGSGGPFRRFFGPSPWEAPCPMFWDHPRQGGFPILKGTRRPRGGTPPPRGGALFFRPGPVVSYP